MENNKIIIALLLIIIVLLVVFGVMLLNPFSKTETTLTITSNQTLHDGEYFSIALTDTNGTPLTNQIVYITIIDVNGIKNQQQVTTDGMGNGMLQLNGLNPGEYTFNVTYGGNDNYSAANLTQKVEIKEVIKLTSSSPYNTEPVYDGHTTCYKDGIRGVYSRSGEFFADEGQFH